MTDLASWLLAQIAAEKALADELIDEDDDLAELRRNSRIQYLCHDEAAHVAYSAGRVLADCAAKRAIVELFPASGAITDEDGNFHGYQGRDCREHRTAGAHRAWCFDCSEWCYPADPCVRCHGVHDVLRLLAQPYADRPGFDPAWKMET